MEVSFAGKMIDHMLHIQWWTVQRSWMTLLSLTNFWEPWEYFSARWCVMEQCIVWKRNPLLYPINIPLNHYKIPLNHYKSHSSHKIAWQLHQLKLSLGVPFVATFVLSLNPRLSNFAGSQQKSVRRLRTSARSPGGPQGPGGDLVGVKWI